MNDQLAEAKKKGVAGGEAGCAENRRQSSLSASLSPSDHAGLDLFQDSSGSTVLEPRRHNGFGIPIPHSDFRSFKDVGAGSAGGDGACWK